MIKKATKYFFNYYISPKFGQKRYKLPTHVNFPITDNCNSKCRMCNVWKNKSENELSPNEINEIFSNRLFTKVRHLGISGGEPTLRKDLLECVLSILNALPKLESLSITSHGFHPTKWDKLLPKIYYQCNSRNISLKINISVDGIGELHEEVRRIKGGWSKVLQTIDIVKENKVPLQLQCTVSKHNVFGVNEVIHFAKSNKIELIFRKATSINRLYNKKITSEFFTSTQDNSFFADFIKSDEVLSYTSNAGRRLFYNDLAKRLTSGTKRDSPCHFQYNGVLISSHGKMFHCSVDEDPIGDCRVNDPYKIYFGKKSKKQLNNLLNNVCSDCLHDQTGAWNPFKIITNELSLKLPILKKFVSYVEFALINIKAIFGLYSRKVNIKKDHPKTIHIIGAYGGEHVGDSAILGGVISRAIKRHSDIKKVIVYSKRVDRTLFWISGLDFDFKINLEVENYLSLNNISVSKYDKLIWAGGPIMEMPIDLFEHYQTINSFVKRNIDFEIIGCGWGPFKTKYSLNKAKKILNKANFIEMRDRYELPVSYEINQDPAFDYLYNYKIEYKEWSWSKSKINEFFKKIIKDNKNTKFVLINLRPIWSKYNKSNIDNSAINSIVLDEIYEVIKRLPKNFTAIFVPFNTDHYGFSDMGPAIKLKERCINSGLTNFFVFDRELSLRDMLYFLQNFDLAICMRFHACIFAKSLGIPVYGIDYTAGEIGKVGGLFKTFNDKNWSNILKLKSEDVLSFIKLSI